MDLIGTLTSLGIDGDKAQGLAGGVLGMVKDQVAENVGEAEAGELAGAIPELGDWQSKAAGLLGDNAGGGGGGGLLGAAASMLGGGGGGLGALTGMLGKLDIGADQAGGIGGAVVDFLKNRLSEGLMATISEKVPLVGALLGAAGGGGGGGIGGMIGGLLGGKD